MDRKNVLIVDDEPTNIELLVNILKDHYDIRVANGGKKALELANKEKIDLVLLDIEMPEMDGYEVCRILKRSRDLEAIPVIFVTARLSDQDEELGFDLGGVDYIRKPFKRSSVLSRVKTHIKLYEHEEMLKDFGDALMKQVEAEVAARMRSESQRIAQEAILVQQAKLAEMGEMIGAIAHQWKQPLNAIMLYSDAIKYALDDEISEESIKEMQKYCSNITNQVDFMNDTVNDFKNFLSPNKIKKEFSINESILIALKLVSHTFKINSISIEINEHSKVTLYGVKNEFKQVLLNLLKNAKDAFNKDQKNKKIEIDIYEKDGAKYMLFRDNAGGIPQELLPDKLFESYITTKGEKGTGIGLQITKKIVEEHLGGKIRAYNQGEGACFEIVFSS